MGDHDCSCVSWPVQASSVRFISPCPRDGSRGSSRRWSEVAPPPTRLRSDVPAAYWYGSQSVPKPNSSRSFPDLSKFQDELSIVHSPHQSQACLPNQRLRQPKAEASTPSSRRQAHHLRKERRRRAPNLRLCSTSRSQVLRPTRKRSRRT